MIVRKGEFVRSATRRSSGIGCGISIELRTRTDEAREISVRKVLHEGSCSAVISETGLQNHAVIPLKPLSNVFRVTRLSRSPPVLFAFGKTDRFPDR